MSDERTFEEISKDLKEILDSMQTATEDFGRSLKSLAKAFGTVANVGSCCKVRYGIMYPDPMDKKLHTKECINVEINYLMNNCSPESVHQASGLTIKARIEQLRKVIE